MLSDDGAPGQPCSGNADNLAGACGRFHDSLARPPIQDAPLVERPAVDDNASKQDAVSALGFKHRFTRPYTPMTNGKAERFIQTSLRSWAYAHACSYPGQRTDRLQAFLHNYNRHRPATRSTSSRPSQGATFR